MKNDNLTNLILILIVCGLLTWNVLVTLESRKERIKIIREEIEPKACSLNEMILGQIYEVMGVEYYLSDVGRWGEGEILELQFRAIKLNE